MNIAFIGLGNMGSPMARNLLKHGYALKVFDLNPALVAALAAEGATATTSVAAAVKNVDAVITMLPSSPHVKSVYSGETGIFANVAKGTLLIDS
ncbi:MAG: NAD(P)-binding domain-containing protein, partial [Gammaproteobacteria bacterium]|nr:NAD(P)-binding domain-containing protein [Gammaproteobacteria bacterium]